MSGKNVIMLPFHNYELARATFAKNIADLAQRSENIHALHSAGVMSLLRPLLLDPVQSIQTSAALAIGRLANFSEEIALNKSKKQIKKRLENKLFLLAVAGLLYQALQKAGINIDLGTFQLAVDVISYAAIGVGVYASFEE